MQYVSKVLAIFDHFDGFMSCHNIINIFSYSAAESIELSGLHIDVAADLIMPLL